MLHATETERKRKKSLSVALLVCGGLLSAALAISLPWFSLSGAPEYIIVIGSAALPRLLFYVGLFFLILSIVLFALAYRVAAPKAKRVADPLAKCLFFVLLLLVVVISLPAVWLCGVLDEAAHVELSSTDPAKVRIVGVHIEGFTPDDGRTHIYELPPYSIIAHNTETINERDPE